MTVRRLSGGTPGLCVSTDGDQRGMDSAARQKNGETDRSPLLQRQTLGR